VISLVTNLPPEARAKFIKYKEAKTPEEKLKALQEFISAVPKHKGTENLLYWARRRMAELREQIEERKRRRRSGRGPTFFIEKEGAAQLVMLGLANCGKSSLLTKLTNAKPTIADYPFTTKMPVPGMLQYQDIQFQIIEAPALLPGAADGVAWGLKVLGLARNADGLIMVLDASKDLLSQFKIIITELEKAGIKTTKPKGYVTIDKSRGGHGIRVIMYGKIIDATADDVRKLLESYRIYSAIVKIYGVVTLRDVEDSIMERTVYKPTIILINKIDLVKPKERIQKLRELIPLEVPLLHVSAKTGEGLEELGSLIFKMLDLVRIYTKEPNNKPSDKPLVLKRGSTVLDVAKAIHKRLYEGFAYAKIWGPSAKYPGEKVGASHIVEDGDIVEIHTKW